MEARTLPGQHPPCPACGSDRVRWRRRRWYDVLRNWLRYAVEVPLHWLSPNAPKPRLDAPRSVSMMRPLPLPPSVVDDSAFAQFRYAQRREAYDDTIARTVAGRFWRCPACHSKGEVFEGLEDLVEDERSALAFDEDRLRDEGGVVNKPIDREGFDNP